MAVKNTNKISEEKKQYSLRIDEVLFEKVKIISSKEFRAMNSQLEMFIAKAIEAYEKENGEIIIA